MTLEVDPIADLPILREAALQDEKGAALDGALRTIESFTTAPAGPETRRADP